METDTGCQWEEVDLLKEIGIPATLEQAAEEFTEAAHAALKLARIARKENHTPVTADEAIDHLTEEMGDVIVMIGQLLGIGALANGINEAIDLKRMRMENRFARKKAQK